MNQLSIPKGKRMTKLKDSDEEKIKQDEEETVTMPTMSHSLLSPKHVLDLQTTETRSRREKRQYHHDHQNIISI